MGEIRKSSHIRTSTRGRGKKLTARQREIAQEAFLASYEECSTILDACIAANIDRATYQNWMEQDEVFFMRCNQAKAISDDIIRSEIKRRGVDGWQEPVISMGKIVYHQGQPLTVTKYSDHLLTLLARSRMPEFREKQQYEITSSMQVQRDPALQSLTDEEVETLERISNRTAANRE